MTTQSTDAYSSLDVYDVGVLLARMMTDLRLNQRYDQKNVDRMVRDATIHDLLNVRSKWMGEKGEEFEAKYRGVRSILERAHPTPEELGNTPILSQSRAYQEWLECHGSP